MTIPFKVVARDDTPFAIKLQGADLLAPIVSEAEALRDGALSAANRAEAAESAASLAAASAISSGRLYESTAAGLAATADGDFFLVRSSGDRFADLYRRSGASAVLQPNQLPSAQAIAEKLGLNETRNVTFSTGADNPQAWNVYIESNATGKQVDGIYGYHEVYAASGSAGYVFHGVTYSDTGVPNGVAGGIGGAIGGPGGGSGVIGNRRDSGTGHGVAGTRAETGDGAGVQGSFQSTGTGAGGRFLKQNTNGTPGGPSGIGPALEATNSSEQGEAINSLTTDNNAWPVSNVFERRNFRTGIIARLMMLIGGVRSGFFTGLDLLINPGTIWTGSDPVTGFNISLNNNVRGAGQTSGVSISNAASGNVSNYGLVSSIVGTDSGQNVAGRFSATGAIENYSIDCEDGIALIRDGARLLGLPVYADNAAAAAGGLDVGDVYRKPDGTLMAAYSV